MKQATTTLLFLFLTAILHCPLVAQINSCTSDANSNRNSIQKSKVKTSIEYQIFRKNKKDKTLQIQCWYNTDGYLTKQFFYTLKNVMDGNYTLTTYEYNTHGCRTKFENYLFNKDSIPVLNYSENLIYNQENVLIEKNKTQYISPSNIKHIRDKYSYNQAPFKIVLMESTEETNSTAYTSATYKYLYKLEDSPEETETTYHTDKTSFTKVTQVKNKFDETLIVKNGTTIKHEKISYTLNGNGFISKETRMNMLSNKIMEETQHLSDHESTTTFYDENGKIINEETQRLPYGFPPPELTSIENVSYQSSVKSDTTLQKNGAFKIAISAMDYTNSQYKLSQTLEYNKLKLLQKQDIEGENYYTVWEYEYY